MRALDGLLAPLAVIATPAAAQDVSALSWLVGEWRGTGTMFGRPSEATLSVRPILGGRFLELSYRAGGFEGRAFYSHAPGGRWRATWFDNRGVTFPIEAREIERSLTSDWGSADSEQGRTVYLLRDNGELRVTDSVRRNDAYSEFATHIFTRAQ